MNYVIRKIVLRIILRYSQMVKMGIINLIESTLWKIVSMMLPPWKQMDKNKILELWMDPPDQIVDPGFKASL